MPRGVSRQADLHLAALLLTASGFAALGHQLLWTRRMVDLLGASAESTVRVFVCFFLGLAMGAACATLVLPKLQRPWRLLAAVELGIAVCCLPILLLPWWTDWIWPALGPERLLSNLGLAVKTGLSFILLVPPAFLMGMTLPVIVAAVCVSEGGKQQDAIRLYGLNTLGGVAGLAVVTGICMPWIGIPPTMALLITVNVVVAIQCYRRSCLAPPSQIVSLTTTGLSSGHHDGLRMTLFLAGFSGAGVMALEVLALQLLDLSIPTSFYPPAAVLFCVILLLAVAALSVPAAVRRFGGPERLLAPSLAGAAVCFAIAPIIIRSFETARTAEVVYAPTFSGFLAKTMGLTLVSIGPAVFFAGLVFPLSVSLGSATGPTGGRRLGQLLAVNGVGGVVGAEVARSLLLPSCGVHVAFGILGICYGLAAVTLLLRTKPRSASAALPATGFLLALLVTWLWLPQLPLFYWGDVYRTLEVRSGREGVLTVFEREGFGRGMSFNNQYLLGGSGSADDEQRQSHVPLVLHPSPERVLFAGLGTGITASGALRHTAVKSVTAIELSEQVVHAASKHFGEFNDHIDQQESVRIHVEDARAYVAACKEQFDVIIGDLFTPWRPGEAGLASFEYFRASKAALRKGGVLCQWFPLHQLTDYEFKIIVNTFRAVFGNVYAFRNHLGTGNIPLALVGFKDSVLDWEVINRRCMAERAAGKLTDPLCRHVEGLALLYFGELTDPVGKGPLNRLSNMAVEIDAGLNLVVSRPGVLFSYADDGNPYMAFVKSRRAAWPTDASIPERLRHLLEVGLLVSRLEVAYEVAHPGTSALESQLRSQFPSHITSDPGADWSLWAGNAATLACLNPAR